MGIAGFLEYIQRSCPQACVGVDLGQLARKRLENTGRGRGKVLVGQDPLVLLVDANSCLHRLYGGSFTDWVCGGQWNSMFHFIDNLARSSRSNNIKLVVFFNGSLEKSRTQQWFQQQEMDKNTAYQVLSHVYHRCSSPGKALWYPPVGLGKHVATYCSLISDEINEMLTSIIILPVLLQRQMAYTRLLC